MPRCGLRPAAGSTTQVMPTWRDLRRQRRVGGGARSSTWRPTGSRARRPSYWGQQLALGYGVIALNSDLLLMAVAMLATDGDPVVSVPAAAARSPRRARRDRPRHAGGATACSTRRWCSRSRTRWRGGGRASRRSRRSPAATRRWSTYRERGIRVDTLHVVSDGAALDGVAGAWPPTAPSRRARGGRPSPLRDGGRLRVGREAASGVRGGVVLVRLSGSDVTSVRVAPLERAPRRAARRP